ncbi:MAG: ubiquinol-cytochrome c reductase iron-sulfur subunit [Planctomycetaceae bacterium]
MSRAERFVAACFVVSIASALGLAVVYVRGGQTQLEGILLGLALAGIGGGLMAWAMRLMPRIHDETQPREHGPLSHEELDSVADQVGAGVEEIRRRSFLSTLLLGAAAALGLAALFPIRSLGKAPGSRLDTTQWTAGARLVDTNGELVLADTLEVGSFITVFPEGFVGSGDSQAVLIRVQPDLLQLPAAQAAGAPEGLVVYSKICTHAGCPLGLYLATTHELRCPCHQSTFDVLNGAQPVYGPAPKPLPQLPIEVDGDGVLRATGDFDAPVGPSYWNVPRGSTG